MHKQLNVWISSLDPNEWARLCDLTISGLWELEERLSTVDTPEALGILSWSGRPDWKVPLYLLIVHLLGLWVTWFRSRNNELSIFSMINLGFRYESSLRLVPCILYIEVEELVV